MKKVAVVMFMNLWSFSLNANDPMRTTNEIHYLLGYIQSSNCEFIRNGKTYAAKKGYEHIQKKYEHFKDDIDSAEMFIEKSAKGSYLSGKPYYVDCPGRERVTSQVWLTEALTQYRLQNNPP